MAETSIDSTERMDLDEFAGSLMGNDIEHRGQGVSRYRIMERLELLRGSMNPRAVTKFRRN